MSNWTQSQYWQSRFEKGDTPWNLEGPSAVLFEALERARALEPAGPRQLLVPGCGLGSDVLEAARRGYQVTGLDWAQDAVGNIRALARREELEVEVFCGDFFKVPLPLFDLCAEHTFFCAIDPSKRADYVSRMAALLRPGGLLVGNFFVLSEQEVRSLPGLSMSREGRGPPFASTEAELRARFSGAFECLFLESSGRGHSERKKGMEWAGAFRRLAD